MPVRKCNFFSFNQGPVTIGNHSWIGANSIVPNVSLGDFALLQQIVLLIQVFHLIL
jgi:acetyltransferase-like isoleucine patch superfamily enzyme